MKDMPVWSRKPLDTSSFTGVSIGYVSAQAIRDWSHGEVKVEHTFNLQTMKPFRKGLFCETIFGPINDYECSCGNHKGPGQRGITCARCDVEVTTSKVRRQRIGHIELAVPLPHPWFLDSTVLLLNVALAETHSTPLAEPGSLDWDRRLDDLKKVLSYDRHLVTAQGVSTLQVGQTVDDDAYSDAVRAYGWEGFEVSTGSGALLRLVEGLDTAALAGSIQRLIRRTGNAAVKVELARSLRIVRALLASGRPPAAVMLSVVPVIPPQLRPFKALGGGKFASSELNKFYGFIVACNNRLRRLQDMNVSDRIINDNKRLLLKHLAALYDNIGMSFPHRAMDAEPEEPLDGEIE